MARTSIIASRDPTPVRYAPERFRLLEAKRARALPFLQALPVGGRLFGSVARGDVHPASDVDIDLPFGPASFQLEVALETVGDPCLGRRLVQATPNSVVKALWDFGEVTVALPLTRPTP